MPEISGTRKALFVCILTALVLLVVELAAQLTFHTIYDHWYQPRKLNRFTGRHSYLLNATEIPEYMTDLVMHPYLGFVANIPPMGFGEVKLPLQSRHIENRLRVLVLGGSVAVQMMLPGPSSLIRALQDSFKDAGIDRDLWIFNATMPGFKQPQQLNTYTFLLTHGAQFDLIVNLDGLNEMTLAIMEGLPKGLHPAYPRGWDVMVGKRMTPDKLRKLGKLVQLRENQTLLIDFAQSTLLARSAAVGLYLANRISAYDRSIRALTNTIERQQTNDHWLSIEEGGLALEHTGDDDVHRYLAGLWRRASVLIAKLAAENDAEYLHVFQPNQYLNGSKVLTNEEREKYYIPNDGFGPPYRATYPYFRKEMDNLLRERVWFVDASFLFKNEKRTVYIDTCCHFNELGLKTISAFIASEIVAKSTKLRSK